MALSERETKALNVFEFVDNALNNIVKLEFSRNCTHQSL